MLSHGSTHAIHGKNERKPRINDLLDASRLVRIKVGRRGVIANSVNCWPDRHASRRDYFECVDNM